MRKKKKYKDMTQDERIEDNLKKADNFSKWAIRLSIVAILINVLSNLDKIISFWM